MILINNHISSLVSIEYKYRFTRWPSITLHYNLDLILIKIQIYKIINLASFYLKSIKLILQLQFEKALPLFLQLVYSKMSLLIYLICIEFILYIYISLHLLP